MTTACRMPGHVEIWTDIALATCGLLAPHATACALGLQMISISGTTVR